LTDRKETLSEDEQNLCEELTNQLVEIAQTLIEEGYHTRSEVIEMVQQAVVSKEK
jgi:metal-responsive CopG/Arc/MetJ family transcriptional regulator